MDAESRVCKRCGNDFELNAFRKGRHTCRACELQKLRDRDGGREGWFRRVLKSSRDNAKHKGVLNELTIDDLRDVFEQQNGKCAVTRLPMTTEASTHYNPRWTNVSLDRCDVDIGYTRQNIIMVCWSVHRMRHRMSYGDLRFWCELILDGVDPSINNPKG
jgi:hypothetical protein